MTVALLLYTSYKNVSQYISIENLCKKSNQTKNVGGVAFHLKFTKKFLYFK